MKFTRSWRIGKYMLSTNFQEVPALYTIGITNRTEDYWHIPMNDFDNIYYEELLAALEFVAREFSLSACIVLASRKPEIDDEDREHGSYHVIFFDKLKFHDCWRMKTFLPVDPMTLRVTRFFKYKANVLRCAAKTDSEGATVVQAPVLRELIDFHNRSRECSWAHYKWCMLMYGIPELSLLFDSFEKVKTIEYNTRHKK